MHPRFLLIRTYYPEFLKSLYASQPALTGLNYEAQLQALFDTGFGVGDAYSHELRRLGCEAVEIICNADELQAQWAKERGIRAEGNLHDWRRQMAASQIAEFQPDVVFVFEWCPLGDTFLADAKRHAQLIVGQIASPLRADRTYAAYDLMLSSYAPLVDHFRRIGIRSQPLRLGFDERVLERIGTVEKQYDLTFVGGLAPSHPDRKAWLESIATEIPINVFGYGWDAVANGSPLCTYRHGEVWGWEMYKTLAASRITLNRHARIDTGAESSRSFANNMRLFEATGVGTCLITETKDNLVEMFDTEREVVAYASTKECVDAINRLIEDEDRREQIARAGQERTRSQHTYRHRMAELIEIVRPYLQLVPT